MIIDKNSWHYKVYRFSYKINIFSYQVEPPRQTNLCQYMRRLIFCLTVLPVMAVTTLAGLGNAIYYYPYKVLTVIGTVVACFVVLVLLIFIKVVIEERKNNPKKPNVMIEYLRAIKLKICPRIEFV